jgi:hypothetical protein
VRYSLKEISGRNTTVENGVVQLGQRGVQSGIWHLDTEVLTNVSDVVVRAELKKW